ncbi:MAG: type II toxin-antitoxin system prevent-host-death family antitoxin [Rudaea sp.]|uniref:type II toxin-antitoxin system prevent-host-death family antitoxin n=1 Tax=Rudaea sp. TaxID=2136325 RepID=UPI0039E466EF
MNWQLQTAKNRLSEVVKAAKTQGMQIITVRGKAEVAMISLEDLRRMRRAGKPFGKSWWESAPKVDLAIERSRETGRDVDLR